TWPYSPERLAKSLEGVSDAEIDAITHENAIRLFHYDPFSVMPKEQSTVGALRAKATGVDTSPKPSGKPVHRPDSPVKIIDLAAVSSPRS
ncbi:MAG: amidohydrolase, partial [Acidimicrobiia bacterium]|nr:amidohydrolase [Acidimicrobiia bacterium]